MFIHRDCGRHAQAVSLGILTAAIIATAARAAEPTEPFVLVAYSNRAGGEHPVSGDFGSAALAVHQQGQMASDPQALKTHRCVAFQMTHQLGEARSACDAAVRDAQDGDSTLLSRSARLRQKSATSQAVGNSNRAVLEWRDADPSAPHEDLAKAQQLAPQAAFVRRNVTAMRAR